MRKGTLAVLLTALMGVAVILGVRFGSVPLTTVEAVGALLGGGE